MQTMIVRRRLAIATALVLLLTACPKGNRIHEAAKASDRIATLIGSLIDLKRQMAQVGAITQEEELRLTNHLLTANTKVKQFNEFARKQTEDTPQVRLDLASAFNAVTNAGGEPSPLCRPLRTCILPTDLPYRSASIFRCFLR